MSFNWGHYGLKQAYALNKIQMTDRLNIDRLIQGIESILSENHYSFSAEDQSVLMENLKILHALKNDHKDVNASQEQLMQVVELIVKFLSASDLIQGLF